MAILEPNDLQVFDPSITDEKAAEMIKDLEARAYRVAPCLRETADPQVLSEAKAVLRRAALRWNDQGSGALQQWANTDGPFSRSATIDTRNAGSINLFYPSEEAELSSLCAKGTKRRARMGWIV